MISHSPEPANYNKIRSIPRSGSPEVSRQEHSLNPSLAAQGTPTHTLSSSFFNNQYRFFQDFYQILEFKMQKKKRK